MTRTGTWSGTWSGTWIERLEAIAVGRDVFATGGRRDAAGVTASRIHVAPISTLDAKGTGWTFDAAGAVAALAFLGDELLVAGGDDGALTAWEVTGQRRLAAALAGGAIRAIAVDANAARGDAGTLAIGRADGTVDIVAFRITDGTPSFTASKRHALSEGPIHAVAWDVAGLWIAGGADGQLFVLGDNGAGAARAITPGGDGGIRAVACLGDGRAVVGHGDGSLRLCYIVGDVEAVDRSGDHGHAAAVRGLALGPIVVDDAGRESARRMFSAGEDGAIKAWFVDGNRRPRTVELGSGPLTALVFVAGPVAAARAQVDKSSGRLWTCSTHRKVTAIPVGGELELVESMASVLGSQLDAHEALLRDGKAASKVKLDVVASLAGMAEDEARVLLDLALASGPVEVRVAAAGAMVTSGRRASRPALRTALAAREPELRAAAFHALRDLERDQPLVAIRAGLAVAFEDVRVRAVEALVPLARTSIVAAGLVADALRDAHASVRRRAFAALVEVTPKTIDAIRSVLARGSSDVRAEALMYLALIAKAQDAAGRQLASAAFDDADPGVRTAAFLAAVLLRPRLAARLLPRVPALQQAAAQLASTLGAAFGVPADDGAALDDDELEPLFAQLACRNADAAIRGAGSLLALGDPRAVGAVLQLTREADPALRRGATANLVLALATVDPATGDGDRLTARLEWLLDDSDADVRSYAFDALGKTATERGPAAELDLAELALRTSQEAIRVRALQLLVRLGSPGSAPALVERAGHLLGDALDDEASKVRSEAFRTLWSWHASDPLVPLVRGAASRHADLRQQVIQEIDRRRRATQSSPDMDRILRGLVGDAVAAVGLAAYAALTRAPDDGPDIAVDADIHLAAMASPAAAVRAAGAKGAERASASRVRARLVALVQDDAPVVQQAAIEAIDAVAPGDAEAFALAFASLYYDVQIRAGELCGKRRDDQGIAPMQRLLAMPKTDADRPSPALRHRAAAALADIGARATIAFQQGLVEDEDPILREMAARGIATAAQPGDDKAIAALVALLGHADLPVRSWAGEGLAKLGDLRALPLLAGTQRHDHRPLRIGAIVGFVALGPDGVRGLRQGLEDSYREIQELAFAVIVARDAALASLGIAPDLLVDAVSSPSPEIRFTAARLYERRAAGEPLSAEVIGELVGPRKPDKADKAARARVDKEWPPESRRAAILQVLADAIASDQPTQRYAAAQVLALRSQPLAFWREAGRLAGPSRQGAPTPHTGFTVEGRVGRRAGWLRRLVAERRDPEASELETLARLFRRAGDHGPPSNIDADATQRLVFGVYAGLVRQAPRRGEADETHRVRRDAIGRLVELARTEAVGADAVLPVLGHAVGDPHHLVRQAAMAALRSLYPTGALAPLQMAIAGAADLGKAAIEELVALALEGDDRARALIIAALDADDSEVREHAALRLQKLYPAGSVEPQLVAAQSRHGDVRRTAVSELAESLDPDPQIVDALVSALASEHEELRLLAATVLAERGKPEGLDVLGTFLKSDEHAGEALEALKSLASKPELAGLAAETIAHRLVDDPDKTADRGELVAALGELAHPAGAPILVRAMVDIAAGQEAELAGDAEAAFEALLPILRQPNKAPRPLPDGRFRQLYREDLALATLGEIGKSPIAAIRARAAATLGDVDDARADDVLARLLGDRDPAVRVAAAESLALRVEYVPGATIAVLEAALRGGRRELVLPAALGLAAKRKPEAFQPLLLVAKAGEGLERERALLALGSLGDRRALDHLLPLLDPDPEDEASRLLTPAAIEAIGRLLPALVGDEAADMRARVERIALAGSGASRLRALTGLRYAGELGTVEKVAADREGHSAVREHAVRELGLAASPSSEALLVELLSDDDDSVYTAAMQSLRKVVGSDRTRLSLHALASPHEDISGPAAKYLARDGDPALLVEKLGQVKSADVRRLLREGLVRRDAYPLAALTTALASADAVARAEASWLVGYAGASARPLGDAIASAVARSAAEVAHHAAGSRSARANPERDAAIEAYGAGLWAARRVGATGTVAVESAALATLADVRMADPVRRAAAEVLAIAASAPALDALGAALGDADREIRATAAAALATKRPQTAAAAVRAEGSRADATTIAPLAVAAWPQLATELITEPATRTWALAVSLHGARTRELLAIAQDRKLGKDAGRLAAIGALGLLGGDDVVTALEAIHRSDSEDDAVKLAAWKALRRIGRSPGKSYAEGQDKGRAGAKGGGSGGDDDDDGDDGDDDSDDASEDDDTSEDDDASEEDDDDGDGDDGDESDDDDGAGESDDEDDDDEDDSDDEDDEDDDE